MPAAPRAYTLFERFLALWDRLTARTPEAQKTRLGVESLEGRVVPSRPLPDPIIAVGSGAGAGQVRVFDADTGAEKFTLTPFGTAFLGGVNVAVADLNHDTYPDLLCAAGAGAPEIKAYDGKTGTQLTSPIGDFLAYAGSFAGGVNVAAADVTGDGWNDVVTAAGAGGGPHVEVFDGKTGELVRSFFAFEPEFAGGVRVAAGDFDGDYRADLVLAAGAGGGPRVRVLDGQTLAPVAGPLGDFYAFDPDDRGGAFVAVGDLTGDLTPDLVVGAGDSADVRGYDGKTGSVALDAAAFGPPAPGGVRVGTAYIDDDNAIDVVAATGPGPAPRVRVLSGATGSVIAGPAGDFDPGVGSAASGVSVAAGNDPLAATATITPDQDMVWLGDTVEFTYHLHTSPAMDSMTIGQFAWGNGATESGSTQTFSPAVTDYEVTKDYTYSSLPGGLPAAPLASWTGFASAGGGYPTNFGAGVTVLVTGPPPDYVPDCPCSGSTQLSSVGTAPGAGPNAPGSAGAGVRYADGSGSVSAPGVSAGGYGGATGAAPVWSNQAAYAAGSTGPFNWSLVTTHRLKQYQGYIILLNGDKTARYFDASTLTRLHPDGLTLSYNSTLHEYRVTDTTGHVMRFNDFNTTLFRPVERGAFKGTTSAGGKAEDVYARDSKGRTTDVRRSDTVGGQTATESVLTEYQSDADGGRVASVTLRRQVGSGSWATVRTAEYAYYGTGDSNGNAGDLKAAVVKDGSGNVLDRGYYRYYTSNSSVGYKGGLKYALGPAAYERAEAAAGGTDADLFAADDSALSAYADKYFEYDSARRVTTQVVSGDGCSACSGGQGTYTYSYSTSTNAAGMNNWKTMTVETLPDGNTNTVYTNAYGEVMLKAYTDTSTSQTWVTYDRYDADGRLILEAAPSAVSGYDDSYADLVHYSSGNAQYLRDSDGLLTSYVYPSTTTATSSTAGDAVGYQKEVDLLHGETGTAVPQSSWTYIKRTADSVDLFFRASSTAYRNDDGTGAETTSYAYTWQGSTAQPATVTTTLPAVTTAENGPNSATSTVAAYDAYGREEWAKDQGGFLTYTEHDTVTGAVTKTIADVDTTQTSTFADLPSGWSTPTGGGLHLTTTYEVDDQGRATKTTYPNGRVDYAVYDDKDHEVRQYPGWDATNNVPTGPVTVTRDDRANNYAETLTMTATPAVSGGRPTGTEAIGSVQSLSREYRNDAGQMVYSDVYFDLAGLTYTTSTTLGVSGTNFYRTVHGYDHRGRQNKTVSPEGTIYRTVSDGLGRVVSEWAGTNDTPSMGYWSPSNPAGMTEVRSYQYDSGGVGDGDLTAVTEHPGLSQADRVTENWFDWRDRKVATKSGVETTESTDVNRPLVVTTYDNLGEVTLTQQYDGDGVTPTISSGVLSLPSGTAADLRAQAGQSYDELGRVYRSDTYSVHPSSGTVGSNTLHSDTWFDARGNVAKTAAPGGLVQKFGYDGAGRRTVAYTTDGGGDGSYTDALTVTGDAVLEQVEDTFDGSGNVLKTVTRERFHDETGTGALGTPSSGVHARVSYSGTYYDLADRVTAGVDVGTNGGSSWTRPSSVPSRSDTVLVTSESYAADAVQTVRLTGSPTGGTFTLTFKGQTTTGIVYNASNATVQSALQGLTTVGSGNAVVATASRGGWQVRFAGSLAGSFQPELTASGSGLTGGSSPAVAVSVLSAGGDAGRMAAVTDPRGLVTRTYSDAMGRTTQTVEDFTDGAVTDQTNKTTEFGYNSVGRTSLTAVLTGGGVQTTAWVYGVTSSGGSGIDSNDVVGATRWPDPTTGTASSGQEDTVTVNALGETATSTDRNGTVRTLTRDVVGRVTADAVTTLGTGVDGSVRRIGTAYDGQGNPYLVTSYDSASAGSVVNQVQRAFNGLGQMTAEYQSHSGAVNTSTTPKVQYGYSEMASGVNHSRLTTVTYPSGYVLTSNYSSGLNDGISRLTSLSDSTGTVEGYSYLGLGTVVIRSHPQPGIDLTYVKQSGESDGDAGDQYAGLDRFGRVVDQRWIKTSTGTATDRFQYGYDRDSNRLYRDNLVNAAFGELYAYDGLNQLTGFDRGTLDGTKTGLTGSASRSQAWDYDAAGNWDSLTTNGAAQTRTANRQNEVTSVSGATTPTFDANGNMTGDETGRQFVSDAWSRLVAVKNSGGTTLETLAYDGLNRRVTNTAGGTSTDLYYSSASQGLEEKAGGDTTNRYVWSPVYVDALVLRDRDTDANGSLDERVWVQQDANWNVTDLTDGSGVAQERYAYDPFGVQTILTPTFGSRSVSSYGWVYGSQGREYDGTINLAYFGQNWYSPSLGRSVNVLPDQYTIHLGNYYLWEGNNPTLALDDAKEARKLQHYRDDPQLGECGDFSWETTWKLTKPSDKGGTIIQKITVTYQILDCCQKDKVLEEKKKYTYWEAWPIKPKQDDVENSLTDDRIYIENSAEKSHGTYHVEAVAIFYEGIPMPKSFKPKSVEEAGILPATTMDPKLDSKLGTEPLARSLTVKWDCCKKKSSTEIVDIVQPKTGYNSGE